MAEACRTVGHDYGTGAGESSPLPHGVVQRCKGCGITRWLDEQGRLHYSKALQPRRRH